MTVKATQPVRIDERLYNDLVKFLDNVQSKQPVAQTNLLNRLEAVILVEDDCIDGDGSGLCETHNYLPMEYYLDEHGNVLKPGTFDPEEEGFPVCPDSQKYDETLAG